MHWSEKSQKWMKVGDNNSLFILLKKIYWNNMAGVRHKGFLRFLRKNIETSKPDLITCDTDTKRVWGPQLCPVLPLALDLRALCEQLQRQTQIRWPLIQPNKTTWKVCTGSVSIEIIRVGWIFGNAACPEWGQNVRLTPWQFIERGCVRNV